MSPCLGYLSLDLVRTNAQPFMFKKTKIQPEPRWLSPKALCLKRSKTILDSSALLESIYSLQKGNGGGGNCGGVFEDELLNFYCESICIKIVPYMIYRYTDICIYILCMLLCI